MGIDSGRTNIGLSVVKTDGTSVFNAEVITRNKDIPKLMLARKAFRQQHRKLRRRDKRRRRARQNNTIKADSFERLLPSYSEPIICHDIKNKEARFNNRKREEGWLTPTANHLLLTHINVVRKIQEILPIKKIVLEVNKFSFMTLDNPNIQNWEYQRGPLYEKGSLQEAIYEMQNGVCLLCGKPIEHYHHILPRHEMGSNTLPNIVGLCKECHSKVHKDDKVKAKLQTLKQGLNKKYGALSVLNQIIPRLTKELSDLLPLYVTEGRTTKEFRLANGIQKEYYTDAYCIACSIIEGCKPKQPDNPYYIRQFRRHDRQACHKAMLNRKYYMDGKLVATNRHKAMEQKSDSLEEFVAIHTKQDISSLHVKEHLPQYKNMQREMPGSIFYVGKARYIMCHTTGSHNGKADGYADVTGKKYRSSICTFVYKNIGLLFV